MGRTLPVPVPCQVCGDKSYGRHYGVFCCDGCSCFFKRSIRRNIKYTCISGDDRCAIDKSRRNWCPACRLKKCEAVDMNKNAVQKERGPRKPKQFHSNATGKSRQKGRPYSERQNADGQGSSRNFEFYDMTLLRALRELLHGPIVKFCDLTSKREVMQLTWSPVFVLYVGALRNESTPLPTMRDNHVKELVNFIQMLTLDPQEVHLVSSLVTSTLASWMPQFKIPGLQDLYRMMLIHHCSLFHTSDTTRATKILYLAANLARISETEVSQTFFENRNDFDVAEIICRVLVA